MSTEAETATAAVAALVNQTHLNVVLGRSDEPSHQKTPGWVHITKHDIRLRTVIKNSAAQSHLGALIERVRQTGKPEETLLIADYINTRMAEQLKEAGVQFADTTGNAYLDQAPVFIYIRGHKRVSTKVTQQETGLAFQRAGMKVIYALLETPELVQAPYRQIAERTGVALGAISAIMKDLVAQGFITGQKGSQRQLTDRDRLLEKWVDAYPTRVQAKHLIGHFTTDTPDWRKVINVQDFHALWGGEVAAEHYTQYLTARNATLYISGQDLPALANAARLRKFKPHEAPTTLIEIFTPFWNTEHSLNNAEQNLAPPLVVYADLIATGDPRNIDTAGRIRERYLD